MEEKASIMGDQEGSSSNNRLLCSIVDKCRTCTFKEMQMMPECTETGFRLIKRCVERESTSNVVLEDKYINEGCTIFNGTLEEFNSDPKHQIGHFAEPGTAPTSMLNFMILMGFLALFFILFLNKRKERILNEIYSKISIVDR